MKNSFLLLCSCLLLPQSAAGDVVTDFNAAFRSAAKADVAKSNPGWSTRTLAMMNGAMYDALQAIDRTHRPFLVNTTAVGASFEAAAAQAAQQILSVAYPDQREKFDRVFMDALRSIPDGPAKQNGVGLGDGIAEQYLAWRAGDGANVLVEFTPNPGPGHWRPDPINPTQEAWGPGWGAVTPFALASAVQFSVPPPPEITSPQYAASLAEVQQLGALNSSVRTADQAEASRFWAYDRAEIGPPPILFNSAVSQIAQQQGNSVQENARLFAATSMALADAGVASWESKYAYDLWRPISAIREADSDGNPLTEADPDWTPLGAPGGGVVPDFTPPFPAYVSGHATFGEATFRTLAHFYGTDDVSFELMSGELPGVVRAFDRFSAASQENARSRIYMGVHYDFDDVEGRALGRQIADSIHANHFVAVPEPSAAAIVGLAIACLAFRKVTLRCC